VLARIALTFALAASTAHAQEVEPRERALALFEESQAAYNAGELERAVALLREAHEIFPEPILLYNLGRALEGLGQMAEAADAYEEYLERAEDVDDRGAIERRVVALRRNAEPRPPPEPAEPPAQSSALMSTVGFVIFGLGAATALTAIPVGVYALDRRDAAVAELNADASYALSNEAIELATATNTLMVVGAVIALAGLVWGLVGLSD
jgi:tetratricopeptide (TPR) repeat protein